MSELLWIIFSTLIISIFALVGVITLHLKQKLLDKILLSLVALSAGALMGGAFLHLMPEAVEMAGGEILIYSLFGFILFFLVEKVFHWRHCHKGVCDVHTFGYMNLIGDSIHNFIDGLIIAVAFVTNIPLGITTAIAIALHEIPQEIGDYGVLVYAGYKKSKALLMNFIVALMVVFGGIVGFFASSLVEQFTMILLPLAAGGFIYIAASDLIPEIRNIKSLKHSTITFIIFLMGILIMWLVKFI